MKWTEDRSLVLSQICLGLFALLLAALDIGCYWAVGWFISLRNICLLYTSPSPRD